MKKFFALCSACTAVLFGLSGCGQDDVADVSLGIFTFKDIKLNAFVDPLVPGVTCHVASIESPLSLTDPSDSGGCFCQVQERFFEDA